MIYSLTALAILSGIASAWPAPLPAITPAPDISKRQDDGGLNAEGCTITFNEATTFENTFLSDPGDGTAITATETISIPAGNGCNCANGVIAGISTTVGNDGQETQYCAAGETASRTAESTVAEAPTPGAADNAGWAQVQCDDGSLDDIFNNPLDQWNDAGAAGAWNSMTEAWDAADASNKESLSNFLGNYFHTKPGTSCEVLGNSNCEGTIECGQNFEANAPTTSPAGYVLLNSIIGVHTLFEDMYAGINDAIGLATGNMGTFVETFSPIIEDIEAQKRTKIIMDTVQMALFLAIPPTLHSGVSRTSWAKKNPNLAAASFDWTYNMIGSSMGLVKDAMESLSTEPVTNEMSSYMIDVAKSWLSVMNDTTYGVLNDPANAFEFIDDGKFFPPDGQLDPLDVAESVEKLLYAAGMSAVWVTGDPTVHGPPVIVISEDVPQDGTGCESFKPEDYEYHGDLTGDITAIEYTGDVLAGALACVGDQPYWLMSAMVNTVTECNQGGDLTTGTCETTDQATGVKFDALQGLDKLGDFGLTKEEIVANAVNSWNANGKNNNYVPKDLPLPEGTEIDSMINGDLAQTRGVVKIPVCSIQNIVDTLNDDTTNGDSNPNFPCPP